MHGDASTEEGHSIAWIQNLTPLFTSCANLSEIMHE